MVLTIPGQLDGPDDPDEDGHEDHQRLPDDQMRRLEEVPIRLVDISQADDAHDVDELDAH